MAISIDDSDESMIAAAGLNKEFQKIAFGLMTYMQDRTQASYQKSGNWLSVTNADGHVTRWQKKKDSLW